MNILHINQSDITGGAAIAVYRLHQGLLAKGINSRFLVSIKTTSSDRVAEVPPRQRLDYQIYRFSRRLGFNDIHLISTFDICNHPFYQEADVLHFHNLHGSYFNYLALPSLTQQKPALLTLHDMWGMTGHCAYSFDCDRWKTGCGKCPYPDTYPPVQHDNTHLEWRLKSWAYERSGLGAVITTSRWLREQAEQSMLKHVPVHHIPYSIDIDVYQPMDMQQCRSLLRLPDDHHVLMFGAQSLMNPRKGGDLLLAALQQLPKALKAKTVLLTLGSGGEAIAEAVDMETLNLGFVESDHLKAIAYSAADVFLFPTRADAFGLVAQEAMACGTPTVAFRVSGVPDVVRPGFTGYLAEPGNPNDFCRGIVQLLEDQILRDRLSQTCREISVNDYRLEIQAEQYIKLYQTQLNK